MRQPETPDSAQRTLPIMGRESLDAGRRWPLICGMPAPTALWFHALPVRYRRGGQGSATSSAHADPRLIIRPLPPARS